MEKKNILNLYPEDFENLTVWDDICNILNIDNMVSGIAIQFTNVEELTESSLEGVEYDN